MIIELDNREPELIKNYFISKTDVKYTCKCDNLQQGDFIIKDDNENILLIIERKSISDLLSSVKDSRYNEQSERYLQLDLAPNKIIYLIEGDINQYNKESQEFKTIYSCIFSLNYKKGFSVLFTDSVKHTIVMIEEFLNRLVENKISSQTKINLVKKQTITRDNINYYMLNLIPGISLTTAKQILEHFNNSFFELWGQIKTECLEIDLNSIKINNRKLSKKIIENINIYLK